jgi:hypothetical protein
MALSFINTVDIFFAFLVLFILNNLLRRRSQPASLPPGPKGLPLLGNILDMPSEKEWLTFARWGEQWGAFIIIIRIDIIILTFATR